MPETAAPPAVAQRYASAYARFDTHELLDVLAPNLRIRQVNPAATLSSAAHRHTSPPRRLFSTATRPTRPRRQAPTRSAIASSRTSRIQMQRTGQLYLMQHSDILTVADGKVVKIDSVCTGTRPT
jgi:ketosteroid isomerase-like protein